MQNIAMYAMVCITVHLISALRYKLLILYTYNPDTLYLRQQGCEDPGLFFPSQKESASKKRLG